MRPEDLARELGISAKHLRSWLRKTYRRPPEMKHQPWYLTAAQVEAVRRYVASRPKRAESREGMHQVAVHLPGPLHTKLASEARRRGLSLVELLRDVLSAFARTLRRGNAL